MCGIRTLNFQVLLLASVRRSRTVEQRAVGIPGLPLVLLEDSRGLDWFGCLLHEGCLKGTPPLCIPQNNEILFWQCLTQKNNVFQEPNEINGFFE